MSADAPANAAAAPTPVAVQTADGPMPCHLWRPPAGSGPGVVVVQEIFGVSDYIRGRAADLAALGYVVLVPEVYWRLPAGDLDPAGDLLGQAMALVQQVDWSAAVSDVATAVVHLRGMIEVTGPVGILGFCFGGGLAFHVAAVQPVDALVSYYGSALGRLLHLAGSVDAPSLHHFGTADSYVTAETQRAIRQAVTAQGGQFLTYEGAGHAFDNPDPAFHHAAAAAEAWGSTVRFLSQHLRGG